MTYVSNETYIPSDDMARIRARLVQQIASMSDAELEIATKTEASLRLFVADLFRSAAQLFGYLVGQVIGTAKDIVGAAVNGWRDGYRRGLG